MVLVSSHMVMGLLTWLAVADGAWVVLTIIIVVIVVIVVIVLLFN
jgi:hypothetical protein